jgi:membrane associated rhomboid family serine protease
MTLPQEGGLPQQGPPAARCYRHPQREAHVRCTRCDRPICPECMRPASVGFHCPDDVSLARKTVRAPRTSVGARLRNSPAYVTYSLIIANIVVYVITAQQSVGGFSQPGDGSSKLFRQWQLLPVEVKLNHDYYQLITAAFLHVSLLHIASNMLALYVIGPPLERLLGPWRFTAVYFLGALSGSAAVYAFGQIRTAEVGASGAIFGLFAASLVLVRRLGLDVQWLVGIVVLNFVLTFSVHNISKLGHIGGFIGGGLAAIAIAGLPRTQHRIQLSGQVFGLAAVGMFIAAVVAIRTATF